MSKIRAPADSGPAPRSGRAIALLIAALALATGLIPTPAATPKVAIDPADLYALAATLAGDDLGGRGAGTDGLARAGGGYGAYLGIIPDFTSTPRGVRLAGVRPDSPAARAGLTRGSQIVALGDVTIGDLYDLTFALRARQPGDQVVVEYLQAGRRRRTEVTLGQR